MSASDNRPTPARPDEPGLPRLTGCLRPLVDLAARTRASIHTKLLAGFLTGAMLLLGLGVGSASARQMLRSAVSTVCHCWRCSASWSRPSCVRW